jgi:hypothetical protein
MEAAAIDWSLPANPQISVRLRTVMGAEHHAAEALGLIEPRQQKYTLAGVARIHAVYCVFRHEKGASVMWTLSAAGDENLQKTVLLVNAYKEMCRVVATKPAAEVAAKYPFVDPARCMVETCKTPFDCTHKRECPVCPVRGIQMQGVARANRCVGHDLLRCNNCKGPLWCGRVEAHSRRRGRFECDVCVATLCSLCKRKGACAKCHANPTEHRAAPPLATAVVACDIPPPMKGVPVAKRTKGATATQPINPPPMFAIASPAGLSASGDATGAPRILRFV